MSSCRDRAGDRLVLMLIGGGLIAIIMAIVGALAFRGQHLPDFSEAIFGALAGGALVKLADVLSALVALSGNRQLERMGDQLSAASPPGPQTVTIDQPAGQPVPVQETAG